MPTDEFMPLRDALALLLQLAFARERVLATSVGYDPEALRDQAEYTRLQQAVKSVEAFARTSAAEVDPRQGKLL